MTLPRPQRRNANKHTQRGMGQLEKSIQTDGWIGAITVAADGETFDGSARVEVLATAGLKPPKVIDIEGDEPVVLRRIDIPSADDPRAVRLGVAANRIAQINLDFDVGMLADIHAEIGLDDLFLPDEIATWTPTPESGGGDIAPDVQDGPTRVQPGEVWQLGRHRLLCGDSTKADDVARLMQGERAAMAWFDPPFGIDLQPQRGLTDAIANDGNVDARALWSAFLPLLFDALEDSAAAFLCQGWSEFDWTLPLVRQHFRIKSKVVWYKTQWGIGYYFRPQHEDILYCWKGEPEKPATAISDVWEHARSNAPEHAAEKPVSLSQQAIEFSSKNGDVVIDWFAGVGGSLIAAERTGRDWRGIELDPKWVDVIIKRWEAETGQTAERID